MILVVDDELNVGRVLVGILRQADRDALHVLSGAAALDSLDREPIEVVITDLRMPEMDGLELLERIRDRHPGLPVIVLTAHGSVDAAVRAMKLGAFDFMQKPFERLEVVHTVDKALAVVERAGPPRIETSSRALVGESPAMQTLRQQIGRVAPTLSTVLLLGETGTGKELCARAIHDGSPRAQGPFVVVNAAALPTSLVEAELFGHEKGAFTGATTQRPGRVELAEHGTLFLDEIGELPLDVQAKLLRVLHEREVVRVGGTSTIKLDVRFVAATHRDLAAMVADGRFREDLYYRLRVVPIELPPLRDRPGDVEILARQFVRDLPRRNGPGGDGTKGHDKSFELAPSAIERLARHPWPGNVRELLHTIERMSVFAESPCFDAADVDRALGFAVGATAVAATGASLAERRADAERQALRDALEKAGGNRSQAARLLGISRRTLYNKLDELS
jgi:DNA-binding NtrC family response regulator